MTAERVRPDGRAWPLALGLIAIAAFIVVGLAAGRASAATRAAAERWKVAAAQIADAQRRSGVAAARDSARLMAEAREANALGIAPAEKSLIVGHIERLARSGSLTSVRVVATPSPQGTVVPARSLAGQALRPASWSIAVEFVGRFADARKFVISLPPSVSISRLNAARVADGARYQIVLSVYELNASSGR